MLTVGICGPASAQVQANFGVLFAPVAQNPDTKDFAIGGTAGLRLAHRHVIEAEVLAWPTSGAANQRNGPIALSIIVAPDYAESFDPTFTGILRYRGTPFLGTMPDTKLGIALDVLAGGGLVTGDVELNEEVPGAYAATVVASQPSGVLPAVSAGAALRFIPHPAFSIRVDFHGIFAFDHVVDYGTASAASANQGLPPDADRLTCDSGGDAQCRVFMEKLWVLGIGLDITVPEV